MNGLDVLQGESLDELIEVVGRLKHDLGKYVAFQIRWLPDGASLPDRVEALRRDLLHTRSGPNGTVDALTVWREFEAVLTGVEPLPSGAVADLAGEPSLRHVQIHMQQLADMLPALRVDPVDEQLVVEGIQAALAVADGCRDLQRRVRTASRATDG